MPPPRPRPFVPVLVEGDAVASTALLDQRGRPFSFATANGSTTVVSFIYTRCRDAQMCPLVAAKFARMQRELRGTPVRPRRGVILHSEAAIVIDAKGRIVRFIDGAAWLPDDVLGAARQVAAIPDDPVHRLRSWLASSASALCGGRGATTLSIGTGLILLVGIVAALTAVFARAFRAQTVRFPR